MRIHPVINVMPIIIRSTRLMLIPYVPKVDPYLFCEAVVYHVL